MPGPQKTPFYSRVAKEGFDQFKMNVGRLPTIIDGIAPPLIYRVKSVMGKITKALGR